MFDHWFIFLFWGSTFAGWIGASTLSKLMFIEEWNTPVERFACFGVDHLRDNWITFTFPIRVQTHFWLQNGFLAVGHSDSWNLWESSQWIPWIQISYTYHIYTFQNGDYPNFEGSHIISTHVITVYTIHQKSRRLRLIHRLTHRINCTHWPMTSCPRSISRVLRWSEPLTKLGMGRSSRRPEAVNGGWMGVWNAVHDRKSYQSTSN